MEPEKFYLTWERVDQVFAAVARQLVTHGVKYHWIMAITRGGLVPASYMAQALNIRNMGVVNYISDHSEPSDLIKYTATPRLFGNPEWIWQGRGLVVDDICDTGKSLKAVDPMFKRMQSSHPFAQGYDVFALVGKPEGLETKLVDFCGIGVEQDTWVVFPWEIEAWGQKKLNPTTDVLLTPKRPN